MLHRWARRPRRALWVLLLLAVAGCLGPAPQPPTPTPVPTQPVAAPATTATAPPTPTATALPPTATATPVPAPTATLPPGPPTTAPTPPAATPATTSTLLLDSLRAMQAVASYQYTATVDTLDNGRQLSTTLAGEYAAPDELHWVTTSEALTTTAVISDSRYYVAIGTLGWTLLPGADRARAGQLVWQLMARAQDVTEVTRDPLTDPDPTVQLAFSVPATTLPLDPQPWDLIQLNVWLGVHDSRVRAVKLFAQAPYYETTERFYLFAFDEPVTIALPQPATPQPGLAGRLLYVHRPIKGTPGLPELRIRDLATGSESLVPGADVPVTGASWAPDGHELIYSASGILYLYDEDTGEIQNLGRGLAPAWSPDGATLAYVRGTAEAPTAWTADPTVMAPARLGDLYVQQLDWAPDQQHLVVAGWPLTADPAAMPAQLFLVSAADGTAEALPPVASGAAWPRFSPDGREVAFIAGGDLAVLTLASGTLAILDRAGQDRSPLWSPDGSRLIYAHRADSTAPSHIVIQPMAGGAPEDLTSGDDLPLDWQ